MSARAMAVDVDTARRCILGLAMAAIAIVVQGGLMSMGAQSPLLVVYPAVFFAYWLGGMASGVAAVLAASLGLAYFILPPRGSWMVAIERDAVDLALFCILSFTLIRLVEHRNRSMRDAATTAQALASEAAGAKEAIIAVVAHDLRNPLQTVMLNADLIETYPSDPRIHDAVQRLRSATTRACELVDTILERAHGKLTFPLKKSTYSLAEIVAESIGPFDALATSRSVRFERPRSETLQGVVECDEVRIVQVLTNVLANALQFTPAGGKIRLAVDRDDGWVRFTVSDTGVGMTLDELEHAFERLWHGGRAGHGSGLGLWVADMLVRAHGGRISARSRENEGTILCIELPSASPDDGSSGASAAVAPA